MFPENFSEGAWDAVGAGDAVGALSRGRDSQKHLVPSRAVITGSMRLLEACLRGKAGKG